MILVAKLRPLQPGEKLPRRPLVLEALLQILLLRQGAKRRLDQARPYFDAAKNQWRETQDPYDLVVNLEIAWKMLLG